MAALHCFARRPAARERWSKTWRVFRQCEVGGRPGDRAWKEPCTDENYGRDACYVQSSPCPVVVTLRDDENLRQIIRLERDRDIAQPNLIQINTSSTKHIVSTHYSSYHLIVALEVRVCKHVHLIMDSRECNLACEKPRPALLFWLLHPSHLWCVLFQTNVPWAFKAQDVSSSDRWPHPKIISDFRAGACSVLPAYSPAETVLQNSS